MSKHTRYAEPLTHEMVKAGARISKDLLGYKLPQAYIARIWSEMYRAQHGDYPGALRRKEQAIAEAEREMTQAIRAQDQRTLRYEVPAAVAGELTAIVRSFESHFASVVTGYPSYRCETGEPYRTILIRTHAVDLPPGQYVGVSLPDENIEALLDAFKDILGSSLGPRRLYWRLRPEIEMCSDFDTGKEWYQLRARLLTTDREPDPELVAQFARDAAA